MKLFQALGFEKVIGLLKLEGKNRIQCAEFFFQKF